MKNNEIQELKVIVKDGLLYSGTQKLNSTEIFLYAVSQDGSIYVAREKEFQELFHHSSFLSGKPVLCAGTINIKDGEIIGITNDSGHYRPKSRHLVNFLKLLQNSYDIDLSKIKVRDTSRISIDNRCYFNAKRYLDLKGFILNPNGMFVNEPHLFFENTSQPNQPQQGKGNQTNNRINKNKIHQVEGPPPIPKGQFNEIIGHYETTSWLSFISPYRSKAINELRELLNNDNVTISQVRSALEKDSARRLGLFNTGDHKLNNHKSTDDIILELRNAFNFK